MRRIILPAVAILLVLLMALALVLPIASSRSDSLTADDAQVRVTQVDPAAYPEIALYVAVEDAAGQPRPGLNRDDFAITEDGQPVELTGFSGAGDGGPISTALVIDRSGSMEDDDKLDGAIDAALAFVGLMRPGDQAALIAFNSDVDLEEPFTDDQAELERSIERLRPDGGTAVYDSIVAGVDLLREQPGRRMLLVLTDGQDCREPGDGCPNDVGSTNSLEQAIAYANAAGQPVYVVGLGASNGDGIDEDVLQQIAGETAGQYFYAPEADELAALYAGLAGNLQQEYRLTYVSPRPFYDGTRRDIRVQVAGSVAGGGYTERHLINVTSGLLPGVVLLIPLVGMLLLPGLRRRRGAAGALGGSNPPIPTPLAQHTFPPAAPATIVDRPASPALTPGPVPSVRGAGGETLTAAPRRCTACDNELRPNARFCNRCGAPVR